MGGAFDAVGSLMDDSTSVVLVEEGKSVVNAVWDDSSDWQEDNKTVEKVSISINKISAVYLKKIASVIIVISIKFYHKEKGLSRRKMPKQTFYTVVFTIR